MILYEIWTKIEQFKVDDSVFIELPINYRSRCYIENIPESIDVAELLLADIEDIKINLEMQVQQYQKEMVGKAIEYYIKNDAFISIE